MYYSQIRKFDTTNGVGVRTTLFVSGCSRNCTGCFNQEYQDFNAGYLWSDEVEKSFIEHSNSKIVQGVSILGGEPMEQIQDDDLLNLVKKITKSIWIYSGYTFEALIQNPKQYEILSHCDVLVDGPFVESLKDVRLAFMGSSNQRVIDVKKSLVNNKVVLYEGEN